MPDNSTQPAAAEQNIEQQQLEEAEDVSEYDNSQKIIRVEETEVINSRKVEAATAAAAVNKSQTYVSSNELLERLTSENAARLNISQVQENKPEAAVDVRDMQASSSVYEPPNYAFEYSRAKDNHQNEYNYARKVLDQARARSRDQIYYNPKPSNGYEKHNGSP